MISQNIRGGDAFLKIIIQIPCFNEEGSLSWTVADLPRYIEGVDDIEYLVIDDGSTDQTAEIARGLGVRHIVRFKNNKGLARGFMAGIDACLRLGADIIVNTDADNQYCGADIEKLARPIINGEADIVIGERPIDETAHFSEKKKKLQHIGSWVVRAASGTNIPDAPSGFRAYSREAALRLNVINEYSYTLETIIQAGNNKMAITSVPVRTNPEMRKSRLFKSMTAYIRRSASVIVRAFMMYSPLRFFSMIGGIVTLAGLAVIGRFLVLAAMGNGDGHVQSLVLAALLVMIGVQLGVAGLQADLTAANRRLLEDVQYRLRKLELEGKDLEK
jgi:glycosyltransferase involved in cell wall biosynthesis